jgi:hypothetical protein
MVKRMSKKRITVWRLWCYALGAKSGKNDKEANIVAAIRTCIFISYFVTNIAIIANAIRHWNDSPPVIIHQHEVPSNLPQTQEEKSIFKANRNFL